MKPSDLMELYSKAVEIVDNNNLKKLKEYEDEVKLYESWEINKNKYNREFLSSVNYWNRRNNDVWDYSLDSLSESIKELEDWKEENSNKIWLHIDINWCHDEYDADEEPTVELIGRYYVLRTPSILNYNEEDRSTYLYKPKFKEMLSKKLFEDVKKVDDTIDRSVPIECKVLTLFEGWQIDWEMVASLTYSDCNL